MGGKEASKEVSFGVDGAGDIRYNEHQQTKIQLSHLKQELQQYGFTNEEIKFIMSSPEFVRDILAEYLKLKKEQLNKASSHILNALIQNYPEKYGNLPKEKLLGKINKMVKMFGEVKKKYGNKATEELKSLQNLIEQRLSFTVREVKENGNVVQRRVWVYQVTTGKETETEEKEKGWRFRIPPGFRKAHPDLARFFDLSNKFGIDARLWMKNPEEAAKQFN